MTIYAPVIPPRYEPIYIPNQTGIRDEAAQLSGHVRTYGTAHCSCGWQAQHFSPREAISWGQFHEDHLEQRPEYRLALLGVLSRQPDRELWAQPIEDALRAGMTVAHVTRLLGMPPKTLYQDAKLRKLLHLGPLARDGSRAYVEE